MKRLFILLTFGAFFIGAKAQIAKGAQQIFLQVSTTMSWEDDEHAIHKTPPQIPNVYLDASTSTVYFENPCYECTLELVIPGTDTVVYTSAIEDGAETFQIPNGFIGTYELHIHRGNYCFFGEIEL